MAANICPLCGQDNNCMMHEGGRCWCVDVVVPSGLIALVPEGLQNQACICCSCIEKYNNNPAGFMTNR